MHKLFQMRILRNEAHEIKSMNTNVMVTGMFNTYSMKIYVLLHFENKKDVMITVELRAELRATGE